jgi:hypothetical protein
MINIAQVLINILKNEFGEQDILYYDTFALSSKLVDRMGNKLVVAVYEFATNEQSRSSKIFLEEDANNLGTFLTKEEISVSYFDIYNIEIFSLDEKAITYKDLVSNTFMSIKARQTLNENGITMGYISPKIYPLFEDINGGVQKLKRYQFQYNINYTSRTSKVIDIEKIESVKADFIITQI